MGIYDTDLFGTDTETAAEPMETTTELADSADTASDVVTEPVADIGAPPEMMSNEDYQRGMADDDTAIKSLDDRIKATHEASKATVDDLLRAQMYESIIGNIFKGWAAYRGSKDNMDLSGVDVKTGINWDSVMRGKLSALEGEASDLRTEREQRRLSIRDRIAQRRHQEQLGLGYSKLQQSKDAAAAALQQKTDAQKTAAEIAKGNLIEQQKRTNIMQQRADQEKGKKDSTAVETTKRGLLNRAVLQESNWANKTTTDAERWTSQRSGAVFRKSDNPAVFKTTVQALASVSGKPVAEVESMGQDELKALWEEQGKKLNERAKIAEAYKAEMSDALASNDQDRIKQLITARKSKQIGVDAEGNLQWPRGVMAPAELPTEAPSAPATEPAQKPAARDVPTGRTRKGTDGRIEYEIKLASGTIEWVYKDASGKKLLIVK